MGIQKQILEFLLFEHSINKPIDGDFLSIGKQTVLVDHPTIVEMFEAYGLSTRALEQLFVNQTFDASTRHARNSITDNDLLSAYSTATYSCLDRSPYEGAEIIQDMNLPLADDLKGRFDFVLDGSVLDNVFDPASFIRNAALLLRPGGRVVHINASSSTVGAYTMPSPEWFFSFYAINNFADCKVYVILERSRGESRFSYDTDLFEYSPYFTRDEDFHYYDAANSIKGRMHTIVIAEKGRSSTSDQIPTQVQYLDSSVPDWRVKHEVFNRNVRRKFEPRFRAQRLDSQKVVAPFRSTHYRYLCSQLYSVAEAPANTDA